MAGIVQAIEGQRHELAESLAVHDPDGGITYGELAEESALLAARLVALGVETNDVVAVLADRGHGFVVMMLAVWKAGAAYLALDPGHPRERLETLLTLSNSRAVLTEAKYGTLAEEVSQVEILVADRGRGPGGEVVLPGPGDIAYLNFTSGSTGVPKPTAVPTAALANLVLDQSYVTIDPGDRVLQVAAPTFDAFAFEVWSTLVSGGTLTTAPPTLLIQGPARFCQWCADHDIAVALLTTSIFEMVVQAGLPDLGVRRTLLFGGELADPGVSALALDRYPDVQFVHAYGPTETTVIAAAGDLRGWNRSETEYPPVGYPLNGVEVFIEDGEIVIGGKGLALGYTGQPGRTAESFTPDPNSPRSGARVYRTGDRGYFDESGQLVPLGRLDRQVKVRGYRIELGEVEAALRRPSGVETAVAVVIGSASAKRLVGLYTGTASVSEVRDAMRRQLPHYMVPNFIERMDDLPRSVSGKRDVTAAKAVAESLFMT